jgi:hypothetical protein
MRKTKVPEKTPEEIQFRTMHEEVSRLHRQLTAQVKTIATYQKILSMLPDNSVRREQAQSDLAAAKAELETMMDMFDEKRVQMIEYREENIPDTSAFTGWKTYDFTSAYDVLTRWIGGNLC